MRGRVIEAGTNRPLAHALVRLTMPSDIRYEKLTSTDAGGRFELAELARGTYNITGSKTNYLPQNRGEKRPIGPGVPIDLKDGQVVEDVNFALLHAGAVTGRITDEFGEPLADTQVSLMRWLFTNGERRLQPFGGTATTNDLGEYRIYGARPGQYIVGATLRPSNPMPFPGSPGNNDTGDRSAYQPTFYPGTPNPGDAQRVTIGPGQTATGMSFGLLPATSARVSGTVIDSQGKPLTNAFINAMARTNGFGGAGGSPIRDGKFTLTLTPGDYTLRAMKGGPPPETETALLDISVASVDLSDLTLVTAKPSTLRGRFVFEKSDVKIPAPSSVRVIAPQISASFPGGTSATAKDDMTFEMNSLPGHIVVRASVNEEWRLARVLARGVDITDTGLDVPPNAMVDGLVVELTTRLARVTGRVLDAAGEAMRDCTVVVFARDPARWTAQSRYVVTARPSAEMTFQLRLPPGEYLAAAFEDENNPGNWNDPDILNQLREGALSFSVANDDVKKIDVKLGAPPIF